MADGRPDIGELVRQLDCDCVYFLMFEGWKTEQVGNRWHYASRWSRHLPVVMVQPDRLVASRKIDEERDPRLPGCHVLHVRMSGEQVRGGLQQAAQIAQHMRWQGFSRPLLWLYNPHLAGSFAALPAVLRVYHATENYFHFSGLPARFVGRMRRALEMADRVIAVSDGVAGSIRTELPTVEVDVVTNGCDYSLYSVGAPDPELMRVRASFERLAVYVGNINARLDFDLMVRCARRYPRTLWAYYGPVQGLTADDAKQWRELGAFTNVTYLGPLPVTQIPSVYYCADLGIIPYRREQFLVENGFPLKALEMLTTKLPVIASYMKPLEGLSPHLTVARNETSFLDAVGRAGRLKLSAQDKDELDALCREHDYDRKFEHVLERLQAQVRPYRGLRVRLDKLLDDGELAMWTQWLIGSSPESGPEPLARDHASALVEKLRRVPAGLVYRLYAAVPLSLKQRIPERWRRFGRSLFLG